jgi:hypothetical protein
VGELAGTPNQKQNASVLIYSRYVTYICSVWWGYSILAQLWSYQAISSRVGITKAPARMVSWQHFQLL